MAALPDPKWSRAILIGCGDFADSELAPLPAVGNNLTDLSRALTDPITGILDNTSCSIVREPDSPAIFLDRLRRSAEQAEDLLIVYYAGHGIRYDLRDELFLAVRQTYRNNITGTGVAFPWVRDIVTESSARTKLLILDCCYSGLALGAMSAADVDPRAMAINGTTVLTSSPSNEISFAPPGDFYTAFSGELITLLRNGSNLSDTELTVQTLFRSLRAAMARRELPRPKIKSTDTAGEIVLRRSKPVGQPSPLGPPPVAAVVESDGLKERMEAPLIVSQVTAPNPRSAPAHAALTFKVPASVSVVGLASVRLGGKALLALATFVLWLLLLLMASLMIGAVVGFFYGVPHPGQTSAADLGFAAACSVVVVICVAILRWPIARARAGGATSWSHAVAMTLLVPLARVPSGVSAAVGVFAAAIALTAILVDTASTSTTANTGASALTYDFGMTLFMLVIFGLSVFSFVRRRAMVRSSRATRL